MTFKNEYSLTPSGIFFGTYHISLALILPFYFYYTTPSLGVVVSAIVLYILSGFSIGVYHRYYSHKSYELNRGVQLFFLLFGTIPYLGDVLAWAGDHRPHHIHTDDPENDPYPITRGFWYAHIGWLFDQRNNKFNRDDAYYKKNLPDLYKDPWLRFQHKHHPLLATLGNVLVCGLVGYTFDDYLGALVITWWLRVFLFHHATFCVNSLAHLWGTRPYGTGISAVDNPILALITFGEAYHNTHHRHPSDYRNGAHWYDFDPNKWLIYAFSKVGLAWNLKRQIPSSA